MIGFSRQRVETDRWVAFRAHYGLEAFYCQPGLTGAHEKGGVEGDVGWFRRNHFVPVPEVDSLAELNALGDQWDEQDEARCRRTSDGSPGEEIEEGEPMTPSTRRRWMTEEAAGAAVDSACRMLRLPTVRASFDDAADKATREQLTYRGFLAEFLLAEYVLRKSRRGAVTGDAGVVIVVTCGQLPRPATPRI